MYEVYRTGVKLQLIRLCLDQVLATEEYFQLLFEVDGKPELPW